MIGVLTQKVRKLMARIPLGSERECLFCSHKIGRFLPYRGGWRAAPPLMRALQVVGSDLDHYSCPVCGCNDRERHLLLYLRESGLLDKMRGKSILHFAPEPRLAPVIAQAGPARHVRGDIFPAMPGIEKIDMLAISYPDESFDFVLANHVLEHVADDARALSELRRVLKSGGFAILQTPFSNVLEHTICDPGVCTTEARLQLYSQEDHVRLYGRDIFARFASAGFASRVTGHDEALPGIDPGRFGVNRNEPFFLFERT
jgi:SAM-dependent methyltransferase